MECVRDSLRLSEGTRETVITLLTEREHEEEEESEMMSKGCEEETQSHSIFNVPVLNSKSLSTESRCSTFVFIKTKNPQKH